MSLLSVYQHGFKRGIVFKFADFATYPAACAFERNRIVHAIRFFDWKEKLQAWIKRLTYSRSFREQGF